MPTIFFLGPKLDKPQKEELVKAFTQKASEVTGVAEEAFVVYLKPTDPEEVAIGGMLLAERRKKGI